MTPRPPRALVAASLVAVTTLATPVAAQETVVHVPASDSSRASSPTVAPRLRGMVRFGVEGGGDKVLSFEYEDGSTPSITAGGGVLLSAGLAYRTFQATAGGLDAQASLGFKYRTIPPAENQDANWWRFPLEGMLVFRSTRGFGIGAGATVHLANALKVDGDAATGRVDFEATPGVLVHAEYAWRGAIFDLRYTGMRYRLADFDETIDASSIGVGVGFLFGRKGIVR